MPSSPTLTAGSDTGDLAAPRPPLGTARASLLVAEREILAQVRSKSFMISTAVLLLVVLASILVSGFMAGRDKDAGSGDDPVAVAVTAGLESTVADRAPGSSVLDLVVVADEDAARRAILDGDVVAALVPSTDADDALGVTLLAKDEAPEEVTAALTTSPVIELLDPPEAEEGVRMIVSFAFGLIFMMSAMTFGSTIAQNTVVEKQTRIVEILLSAVPARALLAGKILGNSVLAFGQTAAIAAVAVVGLVVTGQDDLLGLLGAPMVWFVAFFLVGFVLLASIFAASASLVSRIEDTGTVLTPVMMLTMTPYFAVVFFGDNAVVMKVLSYVPFSAPVAMPVRLFLGEATWWEPLASLVILALASWGTILIGARIYAGSLLRMGGRVKVREALSATD